MKIRNGFVSNSSTSSFVIIGNKSKLDDITKESLKKKRFAFLVDSGDGDVLVDSKDFSDQSEFLKVIKTLKKKGYRRQVFEAYEIVIDSDAVMKKSNIPTETFLIVGGEISQGSATTYDDFMSWCFYEDEDEEDDEN